jgi:Zn-dependent metalloprotease
VTDYTANLIHQNQSGALDEALSDIFGEMVEARTRGKNDWIVGTELTPPLRNSRIRPPCPTSAIVIRTK